MMFYDCVKDTFQFTFVMNGHVLVFRFHRSQLQDALRNTAEYVLGDVITWVQAAEINETLRFGVASSPTFHA